jgi:NhaA family Na+:H+ antiporter
MSFLKSEAAGGIVLMAAAALALIVSNSPLAGVYFAALHAGAGPLSVHEWINDGLMAVFFLLVGLEIKREMLEGRLSTWPRRVLPGLAALGGMAVPAAVYLAVNAASGAGRGWAIPTATDIAFALGVLSLLGPRVPASLKVFLAALAIIDDLGAVAIIAAVYTDDIALGFLAGACAVALALFALNRLKVRRLWPYLVLGALLWWLTLMSGVHATLAGVVLALAVPLGGPGETSPLHRLEHAVAPWTAFAIVPLFGFANAGVSLAGFAPADLVRPIPLGIAAGLFLGKQAGVFGAAWAAVRLGWGQLPAGARWSQLYGVAVLCGIGFTISLFIGPLAFPGAAEQDAAKIGVLAGSVVSALVGLAVLALTGASRR